MIERDEFSAIPALEGFIWPLVVGATRLISEREGWLGVESTDDLFLVTDAGKLRTAIQLKHHRAPEPLTLKSRDLWKTLRVWCVNERRGSKLTGYELRTTSDVAAELMVGADGRLLDPGRTLSALDAIALGQHNSGLLNAYEEWRQSTVRKSILERAQFFGNCNNIDFALADFDTALMKAVADDRTLPEIRRSILAWLLESICERSKKGRIQFDYGDLRGVMREASVTAVPTVLSLNVPPASQETVADAVMQAPRYIRQLELIDFDDQSKSAAARAFLQANAQRDEWIASTMTGRGTLAAFDDGLRAHWLLTFDHARRAYIRGKQDATEAGWETLTRCMAHPESVGGLHSTVLVHGTYHKLANSTEDGIGWHPDYRALLGDLGENE